MQRSLSLSFPHQLRAWTLSGAGHGILLALVLAWGRAEPRDPLGVYRQGTTSIVNISLRQPLTGKPKSPPLARTGLASPGSLGATVGKEKVGTPGKSDGERADELASYLYELRLWIDGKKTYPPLSRRLRERGETQVDFSVRRDGTIEGARIIRSSGFPRLDKAALMLVLGLERYRPLPDAVTVESVPVSLPVRYVLE